MSIELRVQADNGIALAAKLKGILESLAAGIPQPQVEVPAGVMKTKAEIKAEQKAAKEAAEKTQVEAAAQKPTEPKAEAKAEPASLEDLRTALNALGEKKDHDTVWALLKEFGTQKASEVPAEKRAEVIAKANELMGAE